MKNRKTIIVAFVLVACMLVGVGYAAVTDNFKITGQATITQAGAESSFNEDIRFEGIVVEKDGAPVVKSDVLAGDGYGFTASCNVAQDEASFHVNDLTGAGDSKTIVFRIRNYGDVVAKLNIATATEDVATEVFSISTDLTAEKDLIVGENGYVDVAVTVTVDQGVTVDTSATFTITFTAESAG